MINNYKLNDFGILVLEMTNKNFISESIAKITIYIRRLFRMNSKSERKWSHVFITTGNGFGFESTFSKVRIMKPISILKKIKNKRTVLAGYKINIDKKQLAMAIINTQNKYLGSWYPILQLFGVFRIIFVKILHPKMKLKNIKNPWSKGVVCSELIMDILLQTDIKTLFSNFNPDTISPLDIDNIINDKKNTLLFSKVF